MKTIATVLLAYLLATAILYTALDISGLQMVVGVYSNGVAISFALAAEQASWWWTAFNFTTGIAAVAGIVALNREAPPCPSTAEQVWSRIANTDDLPADLTGRRFKLIEL